MLFGEVADAVVQSDVEPASPLLRQLLSYWRAARPDPAAAPPRSAIHPEDIVPVLPYLYMVDVLPGPAYRFRLVGTRGVEFYDHDPTGKRLDEVIEARFLPDVYRLYAAIIRSGEPVRTTGRMYWSAHNEWVRFEALHMPLAGAGGRVDIVMGGFVPANL